MILTPIATAELPQALASFRSSLSDPRAQAVFERIAVVVHAERAGGRAAETDRLAAVALARRVGMAILPGSPRLDYGWNGTAIRSETEAYVILHEVAHFQLAAPSRRARIDFGLGPGPETGRLAGAEADAALEGLDREREEAMASLLGILWEVALGQPALASFLDQNWLEGSGAGRHFETVLGALGTAGFVTPGGEPVLRLRDWE